MILLESIQLRIQHAAPRVAADLRRKRQPAAHAVPCISETPEKTVKCVFVYITSWMEPKGAKSQPKGAKSEPKGVKREPKGAKSEPKGAKREPKSDQSASQSRLGRQGRFWEPFWNHFGTILGAILVQIPVKIWKKHHPKII